VLIGERETIGARAGSVRTIVLENPESGTKVELEGMRVWHGHTKPIIHALLEGHFEEENPRWNRRTYPSTET
jgi:hypothetical protein